MAYIPFAVLIAFHLLFFWRVYSNPFSMARSELLSTFFPSFIHQTRGEKYDPYYWLIPNAHPVLSSFYPSHFISSMVRARVGLDDAFITFILNIFLHILFGSIGWYLLILTWTSSLVALFGALVLTYSSYNIKQQPCILYTIAWFPWLLFGIASGNIILAGVGLGMIALAGYYPIGIQVVAIAILASIAWQSPINLAWILMGFLIGLPQLIPFLKYLPKTIRANKHDNIGRVPWWHFGSLLFPKLYRFNTDVGYWELTYYVGIVPLVLLASSKANFLTSQAWVLGVVSLLLMLGFASRYLPRIPARFSFTFQFAIGWLAVATLTQLKLSTNATLALLLLTMFDLWYHNHDLIPTLPYSELPKKPSRAFNTPLTRYLEKHLGDYRVSGLPYPLFTGHINKLRTLGYSGGMQNKAMAKWRNDTNPNGSGEHDWFKNNKDSHKLDVYRVKYAYTRQRNDWLPTPVRHLWLNPRLKTN